MLQGTEYQLPTEKIDIFLGFILDGLQHMIHSKALDWACVGRQITRIHDLASAHIARVLELLIRTQDLPRKPELESFLAHIRGSAPDDATRYFPISAMLCHHFNGLYVGSKCMNDRIVGAEICNSEGELCYNMSYGTHTCIMRSGEEYMDINPIWDYSHIPGTTSWEETDEQLLARKDWWNKPLPSTCSGGKQNGRRAVIYELAQHDGMEALVTHFAFEDGFVCLGTGIRDQNGGVPVTTVDQCYKSGAVEIEDHAVIHNGIRYSSLNGTSMEVVQQTQTGSWHRNNAALSNDPVRGEVLTLTIHHATDAKGQYAYMISAADRAEPSVSILQNDRALQAIRLPSGEILAVFHAACTLPVDGREIAGEPSDILC